MFRVTREQFLSIGLEEVVGFDHTTTAERTILRRWHAYYGASPETCAKLFWDLQVTDVVEAKVEAPDAFHFLICLYWLKGNETDEKLAGQFKMDEKTARKYKWYYLNRISAMRAEKIVFPQFGIHDEIIIVSVDGVHCRISEATTDPSSKWFSHKFSGPGVAYELAISLRTNQLVSLSGPFTPNTHDLTIYRRPGGLRDVMEQQQPGKLALGDQAYRGEPNTMLTRNEFDSEEIKAFKGRGKARGETFHSRIKFFRVLDERFRHKGEDRLAKHQLAFTACCVLVQYEIEGNHPLFEV